MNLSAAALRLMAEKGLSLEDVAEIVAANEMRDPTNAARQARHREKKKAQSNGVTVTAVTRPPNDIDILTPVLPSVISDEITPPNQNSDSDEVKPEHVVEAWNVMAEQAGLSKAKLTPERRKKLRPFLKRHSPDDITEAIWAIPRSPFLRGENDRGWRANFDFLLQPSSFTKISEGAYDEQTA